MQRGKLKDGRQHPEKADVSGGTACEALWASCSLLAAPAAREGAGCRFPEVT